MRQKSILLFFLVLISTITGNFIAPVSGAASKPLIVGILHSEEYTYATMMKNSFEMALDVINKRGGIKGRPQQLLYANGRGKRKPGERAVEDLVENPARSCWLGRIKVAIPYTWPG